MPKLDERDYMEEATNNLTEETVLRIADEFKEMSKSIKRQTQELKVFLDINYALFIKFTEIALSESSDKLHKYYLKWEKATLITRWYYRKKMDKTAIKIIEISKSYAKLQELNKESQNITD